MTSFWRRCLLLFLVLGLSTRAFIAADLEDVPIWVWWVGLQSDLLAAALLGGLLAPALLLRTRWLRTFFAGVAVAVALLVTAAEIFFWIEFESRLDRLVFHYLAYPFEVLVFLEEQFYLTWILIPFVLLVVVLARWLAPPHMADGRFALVGIGLACLVLLFARQDVLDPSRYLNQAASNGYLGVLTAATHDVEDAVALFGDAEPVQVDPGQPSSGLKGRHLVLLIEESMAGKHWRDPALRRDVFPNLLELADQGVLFEHAFATGSRTTRGMEAVLNGFPPLPGISTTERDGFERLPSLARALAQNGYHTMFAYGGWPNFSNFTRYWRGTGYVETTSREDFADPNFMTSWGASDDDLFQFALQLMDRRVAEHDRVFMTMLTVSHHRPYDLPPDSPHAGGRSSLSALRYADAALGRFFAAARQRPWFEDTLFVVVADHAPRIAGEALIPAASYHVPLVLLAEGVLGPQVVSKAVSTLNVPQTLANLLEVDHQEAFLGVDLFGGVGPLPVEHDYHVGWIRGRGLEVIARGGARYAWSADAELETRDDANFDELAGYFKAAHDWFYASRR